MNYYEMNIINICNFLKKKENMKNICIKDKIFLC